MNIESVREYCLGLPLVTEDTAFGYDVLLFRVCNKIFACLNLERPDLCTVKCDPEYALELRERYADIEPAWHWNKKYWNQLHLTGSLPEDLIKDLIRHSYSEIVKKLPKKQREATPEITTIR